jgi:hypothetical protein
MNQLVPARASAPNLPDLVATSGEQAARRFLEFFASNIRNRNTRIAYGHSLGLFLTWCEEYGVPSLGDVQPLHVAAWLETQAQTASAPTVKQRLAAIRHLFDWLVVGQIVPANPASSVRGTKHIVRKGKTPRAGAGRGALLSTPPVFLLGLFGVRFVCGGSFLAKSRGKVALDVAGDVGLRLDQELNALSKRCRAPSV